MQFHQIAKNAIVALLRFEARLVLKKYKPRVVAVTGSVGKTSTKDAVYAMLAAFTHVRKSEKSFNSEIGLPLTILGVPNAWSNPLRWIQNLIDGLSLIIFTTNYPEWLVLEVGADKPGDIQSLEKWLQTDIVVITRLPEVPVHVEFFESPQAVIEEKASLIKTLQPGGLLLLYHDKETRALEERVDTHKNITVRTFGVDAQADIHPTDVRILGDEKPIGMGLSIMNVPLEIPGALGAHAILPTLVAAGVGKFLGRTEIDMAEGLKAYTPPLGRMHLIDGIKSSLIIDDTYNSSPAAVHAALETLDKLKGRKIAVLGDMLELGRHSVEEHKKVGALAANVVDILVTVGFRARDIAQGALDAGMPDEKVLQYENAQRAGEELKEEIKSGDMVLVKGSQSIRMERAVEELMAEPERASELLVRQDAEWRKR